MERSVAETTPTDSDRSSPNGLPIAATGCPTWTCSLVASWSGCRSNPDGSTFSSATSALGSKSDDARGNLVSIRELHVHLLGLVDRAAAALAVGHHVGVGRDLAAVGDHEAGPLGGRAAPPQDARQASPPEKIDRIVTTPGAACW